MLIPIRPQLTRQMPESNTASIIRCRKISLGFDHCQKTYHYRTLRIDKLIQIKIAISCLSALFRSLHHQRIVLDGGRFPFYGTQTGCTARHQPQAKE